MIIKSAKDTLLTDVPGTLPQMRNVLSNWFLPIRYLLITKTVRGYDLKEVWESKSFMGVKQPLKPQSLAMKPEGQRKWKWFTIHAWPDLALQPDDIIILDAVSYRVMEKLDWTEYGYIEYRIVQDYSSIPGLLLTEDGDIITTEEGDPISAAP